VNIPAVAGGPVKLIAVRAGHVAVNTEPAWAGTGVVFLTHAGEVDIADLIFVVKGDKQPPITNRDIARHSSVTFLQEIQANLSIHVDAGGGST
jgi:hypothetical protein